MDDVLSEKEHKQVAYVLVKISEVITECRERGVEPIAFAYAFVSATEDFRARPNQPDIKRWNRAMEQAEEEGKFQALGVKK